MASGQVCRIVSLIASHPSPVVREYRDGSVPSTKSTWTLSFLMIRFSCAHRFVRRLVQQPQIGAGGDFRWDHVPGRSPLHLRKGDSRPHHGVQLAAPALGQRKQHGLKAPEVRKDQAHPEARVAAERIEQLGDRRYHCRLERFVLNGGDGLRHHAHRAYAARASRRVRPGPPA